MFKKLAVNNIDTPHVPEIIRVFLNEFITRILEAMLEEVSTDFFLNVFKVLFSGLSKLLVLCLSDFLCKRITLFIIVYSSLLPFKS